MKEDHKHAMNIVAPSLVHVYCMSNTATIIKQFSQQLETCLHERYMEITEINSISNKKRKLLAQSLQD